MNRNRRRRNEDDNGWAEWGGYFEAKKSKLQEQFRETAATEVEKISDIFKGVAIIVNGLTNPSAEELKKLMAEHGGVFHIYQHSSTTHIVASNLPNVKISKLGSVPIVKPSWITDSITLGKLLDYRRYLLYTNQSTSQPKLDFPVVNRTAKTASDPDFLGEFYNNSRLHLIATLGAEFKQLVAELRDRPERHFPGREKLLEIPTRLNCFVPAPVIMHIDMDCFFVSVGLRTRPELRGQPVAVTHARRAQINANKEREEAVTMNLDRQPEMIEVQMIDGKSSMSEVASCSYEARKCGVKNGMFLGAAAKLCPDIKTIPYDFEGYKEVSMTLYKTIASYTLDIEAVSCDEMYVDITEIFRIFNLSVEDWARHIRAEIMSVTGCPCSTGFGANRLQARLATKKAKPAGSYYLRPDDVEAYMAEIALADLPGVGRATLQKLKGLGLETCGDVQVASLSVLQRELGSKAGETLLEQARGVDKKPLNFHHERKSVSAEINYGIRFKSLDECHNFLESLSNEVWNRLDEVKMRARCVSLKLMVRAADAPVETAKFLGHGICDSFSKSTTTNYVITDPKSIYKEAKSLYEKLHVDFAELRGMGIQLTKLEKIAPINPTLNKFLQKTPTKREQIPVVAVPKPTVTSSKPIPKEKSTRGRPKGGKKAPTSSKNSLSNFFKSKKENAKLQHKQVEIDFEVLKELPQDIRDEVIREYNLDVDLAKPKPQPAAEDKILVPTETKKRSHFEGLQWCQLRPILYAWMKSEKEPANVDVEMLGEHFKQLALDRQIDMLKIAFNFLHRTFGQLDCRWHRAYHAIVDLTQQGMLARYGSMLFVNKDFDCCFC
ncbi:DNA repair protein REV1 [Asbolus verrucosus]|uniref:DNA repair protein REV1 n=1 Tax=Asbolus verrucosus TaxID=1661398 RepID=A0A482VT37_ASBVE|nr:DNA repair protein REV1 [Asbolus verrucosus]